MKCEDCNHAEMCRWIDELEGRGCDFYDGKPCELLILKSDILLHQDDRKKWAESIEQEKAKGLIILPPYFTPVLVPDDVEIQIEQEPCDDAISREDALMCLTGMFKLNKNYNPEELIALFSNRIKDLPSVNPQASEHFIDRVHAMGYREGYKDAQKQKSGKWIPVSERLPENTYPVNITWVNHDPEPYYATIKDKPFTATGCYCDGKWYWYSVICQDYLDEYGRCDVDAMDDDIEVIAWMPLPKPYEPQERSDKE